MIDLNCHIFYGTDCGPENLAGSLEMCRCAVKEGVRTIVGTIDWEESANEPPLPFAECDEKLKVLQHEFKDALSLRLGFVIPFSSNLPSLVERYGSQLALGAQRHLLISIQSLRVPSEAKEVWAEVKRLGYSIILARPECSLDFRRSFVHLEQWVGNGILLQIDAASITGAYGREVQRFALDCIKNYESSVLVASNGRSVSDRHPSLRSAREVIRKRLGARRAQMCLIEVPARVVNQSKPKTRMDLLTIRRRTYALMHRLIASKASNMPGKSHEVAKPSG
jgi:protein-tyrosine phosphatase